MDSKDFDLKLITAIRRHPFLWNKTHPRYAKIGENRPVWSQIAVKVGNGAVTADDCRKRWKNLRTAYWKYRRALATGYTKLTFELAKPMEFLAPHIEVMGQVKAESDGNRQDFEEEVEEDFQSNGSSKADPEVLQERLEQRTVRDCKNLVVDADNADALFLLSMLPEMGRMSEERKRLLKIDMMMMVRKYLNEG